MALIKMTNGDLIAQTDDDAYRTPRGYRRDRDDPRRFHPIKPPRTPHRSSGCRNCRGL